MGLLLDGLYLILALVTAPWWLRKQRSGWGERFGRVDPLPACKRPRILIHAVSVGEVNLIRPLIPTLAVHAEIVVSTTTDTGMARATSLFENDPHVAAIVRYPLDASFAVARFLDSVRPNAVVLAELELWPNFLRACRRRGTPACVVNGRLSDRSFPRYKAFRVFVGGMFRSLEFAAAHDETTAGRFAELGVTHTHATGSLKWDAAKPTTDGLRAQAEALAQQLGIDRGRPLIVVGSSGDADEVALIMARLIGPEPAAAQILVAPRKPEWFDGVANAMGEAVVRRSAPGSGRPDAGLFLLDTIGELDAAYLLADLVIVGRSFGDLFGSDPMQPAALGKPILIGPQHDDFREPVRILAEAGSLEIVPIDRLGDRVRALLADSSERERMGEAALGCVEAQRGASDRTAALILDMLGHARAQSSQP